MQIRVILSLTIGVVLLAAACTAEDPTSTPTATATTTLPPAPIPTPTTMPAATPTATTPPAPTPTPTTEVMIDVQEQALIALAGAEEALFIALNEQKASGQSGWAALTAKGDQTVVVLNIDAGTLQT